MSRSATPATRNEATTRLQPPKRTTSAELPIGTAIRGSREHLRTVADGCGRLRTVANGCERLRTVAIVNATSSEHTLNPQTPRVKREPLLRIREKYQRISKATCHEERIVHSPRWMRAGKLDWLLGRMACMSSLWSMHTNLRRWINCLRESLQQSSVHCKGSA